MQTEGLFRMEHYTITAPKVRNDGTPSNYAAKLREQLLAYGVTGWTEADTVGVWNGKAEPGTVFTVYHMPSLGSPSEKLAIFAGMGRRAMPDQEAVQATYHGTILLAEG